MLWLTTTLWVAGTRLAAWTRGRIGREEGQTVAEYALVLLVAAAIAGALLVWAQQSGKLDSFFDAVFSRLLDSVGTSPSPSPGP